MESRGSFDGYRMPDERWGKIRPLLPDYETFLLGGSAIAQGLSPSHIARHRSQGTVSYRSAPRIFFNLAAGSRPSTSVSTLSLKNTLVSYRELHSIRSIIGSWMMYDRPTLWN